MGKLLYKDVNDYEYHQVKDHIEVSRRGNFIANCDSMEEARHEVFMAENPCYGCDCYDADLVCSMPSIDKAYACPNVGGVL